MIRIAFAADINGLPKNAQPTRVSAVVRKAAGKEVIMTFDFPVDKFADGRQETMVELPSLAGEYEIAMKAEGVNCPQGETIKTFERTVFPWENLAAGRSTRVYLPFTPIQVEGKKLRTVLREHTLNDVGLLDQVTGKSANTGVVKPMLAAPMRYLVKAGGAVIPVKAETLKVASVQPHEVRTEGQLSAGPFRASFRDTWDYDGCGWQKLRRNEMANPRANVLWYELRKMPDSTVMWVAKNP